MKWTAYLHRYDSEQGTVLFNTSNTALVVLDIPTLEEADSFIKNKSDNYSETIKQLINMGFIIEDDKNEFEDFVSILQSELSSLDVLSITFFGTTRCNFGCNYCFEKGINRSLDMDKTLASKCIDFVENYLNTHPKIHSINFAFFGGEPTVYWEINKFVAEKLLLLCSDRNINFASDLTTNGYIMSDEIMQDLVRFNCKAIQITIDGPKMVHDGRRCLLNGEPTFDTILDNMRNLLNNNVFEKIYVRVNVDILNYHHIFELIDFLFINFGNKVDLSFGIVEITLDTKGNDKRDVITSDMLAELIIYAKHVGFDMPEYYNQGGLCAPKTKHHIVMHPDGKGYPCMSFAGRKDYQVDLLNNTFEDFVLPSLFSVKALEKCVQKRCSYLPICLGGCPYQSVIHGKTLDDIYCEKRFFKKVNDRLFQRILEGV